MTNANNAADKLGGSIKNWATKQVTPWSIQFIVKILIVVYPAKRFVDFMKRAIWLHTEIFECNQHFHTLLLKFHFNIIDSMLYSLDTDSVVK
jgi:hypothetical protein